MRGLISIIFGVAVLAACKPTTSDVSAPVNSVPPMDQGVSDPNDPRIATQGVLGQSPEAPNLRAAKVDDIDFNSYSQDLAIHLGLEMGETRLDAIDKIRLYFSPEPGTNIVNLTSSTFELDDGSVMLFARNDLPDDSVFAEEIYAIFSGPGEANKFNQTLAAFGLRVKCRRGNNAMEWTTELCP